MGVPKLWEDLEGACEITTWGQLAEPAFVSSLGVRGLRVGIDLSAWLFHMGRMNTILDADGQSVNPGKNADLRMVFFRLAGLIGKGVLPFFVFDGPYRPSFKRGRYVASNVYGGRKPADLKEMFGLFGVEWRIAPGEAEAELAAMNATGEIDVILTDDVDAFLFGAEKVVRNPSKTLSSNKSKTALARTASQPSASQLPSSQSSLQYLPVDPAYAAALPSFTSANILNETELDRDSLIFVALLAGGDYVPEGFERAGRTVAIALAKGGYAKSLLDGVRRLSSSSSSSGLVSFLDSWRSSVAKELRTNEKGHLGRREHKLSRALEAASEWPSLEVIDFYLHPRVSSSDPDDQDYAAPPEFDGEIDLPGLVDFCQDRFEWGHDEIESRMRNLVYLPLAMQALRKATLAHNAGSTLSSSSSEASLPRKGWISSVSDLKSASSTDYLPSYRLELSPSTFDNLVRSCLPSLDPFPLPDYNLLDPSSADAERAKRKALGRLLEKPKEPSTSAYRHWVPVGFAEGENELSRRAEEYEEGEEEKRRALAEKEERKKVREEGRSSPVKRRPVKAKAGGKGKAKERRIVPSDDESSGIEDLLPKKRSVASKGKGKAKPMEKSLLDETASEDDLFGALPTPSSSQAKSKEKTKVKKPTQTLTISSSSCPAGSSSDLEVFLPASSRRPLKKPSAQPFSAFTSTKQSVSSTFTSSKPGASTSSAKAAPPPSTAPRKKTLFSASDDDLFDLDHSDAGPAYPTPSSPRTSSASAPSQPFSFPASPSKNSSTASSPFKRSHRAVSPSTALPPAPTLSSTSEDDGSTRRKVGHVDKAGRGSREEKSPRKTRPVAGGGEGGKKGKGKAKETSRNGVIDLLSSTDEKEDGDEDAGPSGRTFSGKGGEQEKKKKVGGGLEDFWAKRKEQQAKRRPDVIELSDSD
ncbi:hypothetical protein JCM8547_003733 [Rhodosporidiobolus lusitaniae]